VDRRVTLVNKILCETLTLWSIVVTICTTSIIKITAIFPHVIYFSVWYDFLNKQRLFPCTAVIGSLCVPCQVGTGFLNMQVTSEFRSVRAMWCITPQLSSNLTLYLCLILSEQFYIAGRREAEPPDLPSKVIVRRNIRLNLPRQGLLVIISIQNVGLQLPNMYSSKESVVKRQKVVNRPCHALD
jgi:hypothetical protein